MIGSSADGGTVTDPVRYVNNIDGTLRLGSGVQRGETTEICRDGPGRFRQAQDDTVAKGNGGKRGCSTFEGESGAVGHRALPIREN